MEIRYQIIHNTQIKIDRLIENALLETLEDTILAYLDRSEYPSFPIEIAYSQKIDKKQKLTAIILNLDKAQFDGVIGIEELLSTLHLKLFDNEDIKHITKFTDGNLLKTLKEY